jgi:hypothetical protein
MKGTLKKREDERRAQKQRVDEAEKMKEAEK